MKSHVTRVVRAAQRRNERVSAFIRIAVFVVLLTSLIPVRDEFPWSSLPVTILSGYGAIGLLSLALAQAGVFRPWFPWAYATLDVSILVTLLTLLTDLHGIPLRDAFRVPGAAMIFLFLAQAALRYQSALVLYTAALYVASWVVLVIGFGERGSAQMSTPSGADLPLHVEYLRLVITVLVALILALVTYRTRKLLQSSIVEARSKSNLAKYLPANLVREMADNGIHLIEESRRQIVAVLFIDIRNFTGMSENMDPSAVTDLLTEFRRRMTQVILSHGGTLDKFIGDAIMVEFGIPEPSESDARDALLCGVGMLRVLGLWNTERASLGLAPVEAGIGAHLGEVIAGALGDAARLEYTVIGDTVNIAERIEHLTRQANVPMLVSEALFDATGEIPPNVTCTALPPQALRGREKPIGAYAIRPSEDFLD
jgi:adenylate cyclase